MGGAVVGGAGDGGRGHVGDGDAVAQEVRAGCGGLIPIGGCRQIERRRVHRTGAVAVQDAVDGESVCCIERHRESRRTAGSDTGRRERIATSLARDAELGHIDGVAAHDIDRRHTQNARGGIVGGPQNGWGSIANRDAVAGLVLDVAPRDDAVPVIRHRQVVGGGATGGSRSVFTEQTINSCDVGTCKSEREAGSGRHFHIARGAQCARGAPFSGDGEGADGDVVGGADGLDQIGTGDGKDMAGTVIGGAGDGGRGHVGDSDTVARQVCRRVHGRIPPSCSLQIEGGATDCRGAVVVQNAIDGQLVCRVERDRKSCSTTGGDSSAGQGVRATLPCDAELAHVNRIAVGHVGTGD